MPRPWSHRCPGSRSCGAGRGRPPFYTYQGVLCGRGMPHIHTCQGAHCGYALFTHAWVLKVRKSRVHAPDESPQALASTAPNLHGPKT